MKSIHSFSLYAPKSGPLVASQEWNCELDGKSSMLKHLM